MSGDLPAVQLDIPTIEASIDVEAPVSVVYEQWTQFEKLPHFMDTVSKIERLSEERLRWIAEVGGREYDWEAEIVEQIPDERIAWREVEGRGGGAVSFSALGDAASRVSVRIEWEPEGALAKLAEMFIGLAERQARSELENFKRFVESEG